jgi:hypothetical protein
MSTKLLKSDPTCSNIQLIDENACLGDSLSIINSNVTNLSSGLDNLTSHVSQWNNILSLFYANSATMVETMLNIQSINDAYVSPYTTIQLLSSQWNTKIFSIYYPEFYELITFLSNVGTSNDYKNNVLSWLNVNFPPSSFADGQIINVFVNLYYTNHFIFSYQGNYIESCSPNYHGDAVLTCTGAGADTRHGGCNHDAGGRHWCDNAYSYCNDTMISDVETYTCQGTPTITYDWTTVDNDPNGNYSPSSNNVAAGNLNISYDRNGNDTFLARIITYTFQNINSNWE